MRDEPNPIPNDGIATWDLVIADMEERKRIGRERYGTDLQTFNGRNSLNDAYQESMDLTVYLKNKIEENEVIADRIYEAINLIGHGSLSGAVGILKDVHKALCTNRNQRT